MTAIKMDVDGLDNPDRAKLLSVVDEFRAIGISKEISLPQLVVVGGQSSGKSSLLEGLTGISFPTHSGLCTRFATRIILRRSSERQAKIFVIPGPSSVNDPARKEALLAFKPKIGAEELVGERFTKIMDEAAIAMGLPSSDLKEGDNPSRRFSDDVLSIELAGPEHQHLSIVDVPGLFHNPTPTQTQGDLDTIRGMILSYMKDKRTIMLTVMDALNNLANQEIFNMAKSADSTGERIVGVITKCDAVSTGDEGPILKVAQNEDYVFRHGWFAVRNRSTKEKKANTTLAQRHAKEAEFFQTSPWSQLSKERVGVPALKIYLAQLLYDHIRREFPQLVDDIRTKVVELRQQVAGFGESRKTASEQRQFLTRLANQYQTHNTEASRGNYGANLKANDPRKLRMHIALQNEKLAARIHAEGHTHKFKKTDDAAEVLAPMKTPTLERLGIVKNGQVNGNGNGHNTFGNGNDGNEVEVLTDIYDWIRLNYRTSRGAELPGTVNPAVLESLFRQQAAKWEPIAKEYLGIINDIVLNYLSESSKDLIADPTILQRVTERNKRAVNDSRDLAMEQLEQILEDEFGGILQTTNHYFSENLNKNRYDRILHRLKKYLGPRESKDAQGNLIHMNLNLEDLLRQAHLSNEDTAVYNIHDILKAYYKVAMKRFVDTVVLQVGERHYMGASGPLKKFSPEQIGGLSDEDLKHLAGESRTTTMERERHTILLGQLERALKLGEAEQ